MQNPPQRPGPIPPRGRPGPPLAAVLLALLQPDLPGATSFGPARLIEQDEFGWQQGLSTGDLDQDGLEDIVFTNRTRNIASWIPNRGDGTFAPPRSLSRNLGEPDESTIVDLDADGDLDVVVASERDVIWLESLGGGDFAPRSTIAPFRARRVRAVDADGDGHLDLIIQHDREPLKMILGDGAGNFSAPVSFNFGRGPGVEVVDADADGLLDLFYLGTNSLAFFPGRILPGFDFEDRVIIDGALRGGTSLEVADFNGDGLLDLLPAEQDNRSMKLYRGAGARRWTLQRDIADIRNIIDSAAGDFDRDGDLDAVFYSRRGETPGSIRWIENGGVANFSEPQLISDTIPEGGEIVAIDIDADGDPDLVASDWGGGTWWFENFSELHVPPVIEFFRTDVAVVRRGDPVTLRWSSTGGTLTLEPGVGAVGGDSVSVALEESTTYTLTATNENGVATAQVSVFVTVGDGPNTPPVEVGLADLSLAEDAGPVVVDLRSAFLDRESPVEDLRFRVVSNSGGDLVSAFSIDAERDTLTVTPAAGQPGHQRVTVRATDPGGLSADASFQITNSPLRPVVDLQPVGIQVAPGDDAVFRVSASGPGFISYRWWKDGERLVGANTAVLTISRSAASDAGIYHAVVSNPNGSTESVRARLAVTPGAPLGGNRLPGLTRRPPAVVVVEDTPSSIVDLASFFTDAEDPAGLAFSLVGDPDPALLASARIGGDTGTRLLVEPAPDAHGSSSLTVRATDPDGGSTDAVIPVEVTPVNDPPLGRTVDDLNLPAGTSLAVVDLSAAFVDPDGTGANLNLAVTRIEGDPVLAAARTGAADGTLQIRLIEGAVGTAVLTVRHTDGGGLTAEVQFRVIAGGEPELAQPAAPGSGGPEVSGEAAAPAVREPGAEFYRSGCLLSFYCPPRSRYRVYSSASLSAGMWSPLTGETEAGPAPVTSVFDATARGQRSRFYRVFFSGSDAVSGSAGTAAPPGRPPTD